MYRNKETLKPPVLAALKRVISRQAELQGHRPIAWYCNKPRFTEGKCNRCGYLLILDRCKEYNPEFHTGTRTQRQVFLRYYLPRPDRLKLCVTGDNQ